MIDCFEYLRDRCGFSTCPVAVVLAAQHRRPVCGSLLERTNLSVPQTFPTSRAVLGGGGHGGHHGRGLWRGLLHQTTRRGTRLRRNTDLLRPGRVPGLGVDELDLVE